MNGTHVERHICEPTATLLLGVVMLGYFGCQVPSAAVDKDGAEFVLALTYVGVPHPTGYPVYVLMGSVFAGLVRSLGATPEFAANAWCAIGGAMTLALLFQICLRFASQLQLTRLQKVTAALLPALFLALNPMYAVEASTAEVYSWHTAWTGLCILAFMHSMKCLNQALTGESRHFRLAAFWGLVVGLGAAHHATSVLTALPLSACIIWTLFSKRFSPWKHIGIAVLFAIVPAASYGWIAYKAYHPAAFHWPTLDASLPSVIRHITGADYAAAYLGRFSPSTIQKAYLAQYVAPLFAVGIAGLCYSYGQIRRYFGVTLYGLLTAVALNVAYALCYGVADPVPYFFAPILILLGFLPAAAPLVVRSWQLGGLKRAMCGAGAVICVVVAGYWQVVNVSRVRLYRDFDYAFHELWNKVPDQKSILFFPDDMYWKLKVYQMIRHEKLEVEVINTSLLTHKGPQERFIKMYGFDPLNAPNVERDGSLGVSKSALAGTTEDSNALRLAAIHQSVNLQTTYPVIIFDPMKNSVRLLRKGAATRSPTIPPNDRIEPRR